MRISYLRKILFFGLSALLLTAFSMPTPADVLRIATTTSTDNSGLLRVLLPVFENKYHVEVHSVAVGTGKAIRMGRDGDVDLILVHAREAELKFMNDGYGALRQDVMYNDFVILGPKGDPARVGNAETVVKALERVANNKHVFISRGDDSGTHKKEISLWQLTGINPTGSWYKPVGQGMGKTLTMANELDGYTLSDRGTWIAIGQSLPYLDIVFEGDSRLHNPYGVIAVSPEIHPNVDFETAKRFVEWITSEQGQNLIRDFRIRGKPLFYPLRAE